MCCVCRFGCFLLLLLLWHCRLFNVTGERMGKRQAGECSTSTARTHSSSKSPEKTSNNKNVNTNLFYMRCTHIVGFIFIVTKCLLSLSSSAAYAITSTHMSIRIEWCVYILIIINSVYGHFYCGPRDHVVGVRRSVFDRNLLSARVRDATLFRTWIQSHGCVCL